MVDVAPPRFEPRLIQQVLDDAAQVIADALDARELRPIDLWQRPPELPLHQVQVSEQRVQGAPDLVADTCDKEGFCVVRLFGATLLLGGVREDFFGPPLGGVLCREVTNDFREALQVPVPIEESRECYPRPERGPIIAHAVPFARVLAPLDRRSEMRLGGTV